MMLHILVALLAFLPLATPVEGGLLNGVSTFFKRPRQPERPSIRVLIAIDSPTLQVEVNGPFKGYDPRTGENILVSKLGKKGVMQVMDGGLRWSEEFPGVHQMLIVPTNPTTKIIVNGTIYPGVMYFYDVENRLSAVNKVDMESYLASIMIPQNGEEWPGELLSALVILARTNAYHLAENPKNPYWAVDGSRVGYRGVVNTAESPAIINAINETKHMILSKTGAYEGIVTPFLGYWKDTSDASQKEESGISSNISLVEAEKMARNGSNAAYILSKAFPGATIQLTLYPPGTRR